MISQTVEYALRAVVYLADQAPEARTTRQIAKITKVPAPYLSKVLQCLRRAEMVHSRRGVGGGVSLACDPAELTILQVVNAVEPMQRITQCPLGLAAHGVRLCPLHTRLDAALEMMEAAFRNTTLAELLATPSEIVPLCEFPSMKKKKGRA